MSEKPRRFLELLPETPAASLQGDNELTEASATTVNDFRRCKRHGYVRHKCGVRAPQSFGQSLGAQLDDQWTEYLTKGTPPTNPLAIGALTVLPSPMTPGVLVQRPFQFASCVPGVTWIGYVDLWDGRNAHHVITDHKCLSKMKHAKTEADLAQDPQMVLYAEAVSYADEDQTCPKCHGTGKSWGKDCRVCVGGVLRPVTALGCTPPTHDAVTVRHLITNTSAKPGRPPREVAFTFDARGLMDAFAKLEEELVEIAEVWAIPKWEDVPATGRETGGCASYGGCPYLRFCDALDVQIHGPEAVAQRDLTEILMTMANTPNVDSLLDNYRPPAGAVAALPPDAPRAPSSPALSQLTLGSLPPPPPPPPPGTVAEVSIAVWGKPTRAWLKQDGPADWTAWTETQSAKGETDTQAKTRLVGKMCAVTPNDAAAPSVPPPPPVIPATPGVAPPPPDVVTATRVEGPERKPVVFSLATGEDVVGHVHQRKDGMWVGELPNGVSRVASSELGAVEVLKLVLAQPVEHRAPVETAPEKAKEPKEKKPKKKAGTLKVAAHGQSVAIQTGRAEDGSWYAETVDGPLLVRLPGYETEAKALEGIQAHLMEALAPAPPAPGASVLAPAPTSPPSPPAPAVPEVAAPPQPAPAPELPRLKSQSDIVRPAPVINLQGATADAPAVSKSLASVMVERNPPPAAPVATAPTVDGEEDRVCAAALALLAAKKDLVRAVKAFDDAKAALQVLL